jgi:pimeloyl-ACP methyl ester carboxylesterase
MAVNIVYLPGIFGSRLGLPSVQPLAQGLDVWPPGLGVLTGLLLQLQLAADGVSPGPQTYGLPLVVNGLVEFEYRPLSAYMTCRGWNVLEAAYDWRLSVVRSAPAVLAAIQKAFGAAPFVFVAHSMGGLVARAVYALMVNAGLGGQVKGIVTLGTPHYGSWEAVRGFFGLPQLYQALAIFQGIQGLLQAGGRIDLLDVILASWPGWYELLPWRDAGPLAIADPATAQALYQLNTYAGGSPYVSQACLNAAVQTQHYLAPAIPFNQLVTVRGVNFVTPNEVNPPNPLSSSNGYKYTGGGDGQVPSDYATVAPAPIVDRSVEHAKLPLDTRVWPAVVWAVQYLVGQGA